MKIYGNVCSHWLKISDSMCGCSATVLVFSTIVCRRFRCWLLFTLRIIVHYIKSKIMIICSVGEHWIDHFFGITTGCAAQTLVQPGTRTLGVCVRLEFMTTLFGITMSNKHSNEEKRCWKLQPFSLSLFSLLCIQCRLISRTPWRQPML